MYLKRLELRGFKTFAASTIFEFDRGITAIVGPNGSGKSNVADAIRWALGEQSMRNLRSRKSEDLIFAGSTGRSALGLAEVALSFENPENKTALPFDELLLARRLYRSGDGEYLLNRSRVRLRDIQEALGPVALTQNSYVVVGQGAVDAALSLRPEERRTLFEDAADVRRFHSRLDEARNKLGETENNLVRLADIMTEIKPRLAVLERQARAARQRRGLEDELEQLLRRRARRAWDALEDEYALAEDRLEQAMVALQAACDSRTCAEQESVQRQERLAELRRRIQHLETERNRAQEHLAQVKHEVVITEERAAARERACADLQADLELLDADAVAFRSRVAEAEAALAALDGTPESEDTTLELRTQIDALARKRATTERRLNEARAESAQLHETVATLRAQLAALDERRAALLEDEQGGYGGSAAALAEAEERCTTAKQTLGGLAQRLHTARERLDGSETARQAAEERRQQNQRRLSELTLERGRVAARLEALSERRDAGDGYYAGVRAVLRWATAQAAKSSTNGHHRYRTVADILEVPRELEVALEAALGGHIQDIVVDAWEDAEAAIAHLKRQHAGRATFLPLDTLRTSRPADPPAAAQRTLGAALHGVATTLVDFDERERPAVEHLLGRTLIVDDLPAARRLLGLLGNSSWQIVTLGGEVVRSSGAVTGGAQTEQNGSARSLLARERELRELSAKVGELDTTLKQVQAERSTVERELTTLSQQTGEASRALRTLDVERATAERDLERLERELQWQSAIARRRAEEARSLDERTTMLQSRLNEHEAVTQTADAQIGCLQQEQQALGRDEDGLRAKLASAQTAAALREQERRARTDILQGERARLQSVESRRKQSAERLQQFRRDLAQLQSELKTLRKRQTEATRMLASLDTQLAPLNTEMEQVQHAESRTLRAIQEAEATIHKAENEERAATLDVRRIESAAAGLRAQLVAELARLGRGEGEDDPIAQVEPLSDQEAASAERQIERLRNQLRAMGAINPVAEEEYREEQERYTLLNSQIADMEQAAASLQQVITDLEAKLETQFSTSFEAIGAEFSRTFTELFGGGSAKLVLTQPDDPAHSGVDIIAQPPGKRRQNLAQLSGGERALTAVALLFAILRHNPLPFCVLDEVDAALDEANVARFGSSLRRISQDCGTQFLVITHNRATMEASDALYGITMGADNTSRIVSLRLAERAG